MRCLNQLLQLTLLFLVVGLWSRLDGQVPGTHQGFWLGAGLGYGSWDRTCDGCGALPREGSLSGYLNLGGSLSPRFRLGLEASLWAKTIGPFDDLSGQASLAAYFHPWKRPGFFVKAGGGISYFRASGPPGVEHAVGPGLLAGLGYEIRVAGKLALVPAATFLWGALGKNTREGVTVNTGVTQNLVQITLGLQWH